MDKRVHIAIGVQEQDLIRAIRFYEDLFNEPPTKDGQVFLGTGREVTGAYWELPHIYFYVFIGKEFSRTGDIDHVGIQYDNPREMEDTRIRMNCERWLTDPVGITWELFPTVDTTPEEKD